MLLLDPAFLHDRFIQFDAQARTLEYGDLAVNQWEAFGHQALVEVGRLDAVFHVFGLFHGGQNMKRGCLDDAGTPGMEHAAPTPATSIIGDP